MKTCQPIANSQVKPFTFHRPKPAADAGFPKAPPKGVEGSKTAPRKRGPKTLAQQAASALRTDEERKADKLAKATAFHPSSCNFSIKPTPSKPVSKAGSRFATA